MGTFNAVPQSAVMRSNSWWRGVSSLRAGRRRFGGRSPRRRGRDSSVDAPGAPARRGVSAAFGMGGRGRVDGRAGGVSRRGRGFRNGTLASYSSKLRSVDMRSSSSSGIGQDMVESLRASYQNPCWAARRRVPDLALRRLVTGEVVTT